MSRATFSHNKYKESCRTVSQVVPLVLRHIQEDGWLPARGDTRISKLRMNVREQDFEAFASTVGRFEQNGKIQHVGNCRGGKVSMQKDIGLLHHEAFVPEWEPWHKKRKDFCDLIKTIEAGCGNGLKRQIRGRLPNVIVVYWPFAEPCVPLATAATSVKLIQHKCSLQWLWRQIYLLEAKNRISALDKNCYSNFSQQISSAVLNWSASRL